MLRIVGDPQPFELLVLRTISQSQYQDGGQAGYLHHALTCLA